MLPYDLVDMLLTPPASNSNPIVSEKWKELGPIDLKFLVQKMGNFDQEQTFG